MTKARHWLGIRKIDGTQIIEPKVEEGFPSREAALMARRELIKAGTSNRDIIYLVSYEEEE